MILNSINASANTLKEVESRLFEVKKLPLYTNVADFLSPKDSYGIYKSTGGNPLSVMGKDFTPMQPKEFLGSIVNTVQECGSNLNLSTLEFNEYKGGKQIEFSIMLEPLEFTNKAGIKDVTENKLTFSTSFDGSKSNVISLYTYRQICSNGMMGWGMDSQLKGKNTIGGKAKILTYCDEVVKIISETKEFNDRMVALDKINVSKAQIEAFKFKLLGYNAASLAKSDKAETKKINILERINQSIELEFERTGETAFGLLQGITYYTNHEANNSTTISDDEFIRFYNGAKMNNKAQELLFAKL